MSVAVQKISCVNSAAFVMSFKVRFADEDGNELNTGWESDNFPVGQSRTCDLSGLSEPIPEGSPVWIEVHAVLGKTKSSSSHKYQYAKNGQTASFKVTGTTLIYEIQNL